MISTKFFYSSGLLVFALFFLAINQGSCTVKTASLNGNWEAASTWSTNSIPGCGDTLIVPSGRVITVTQQDNYTGCSSPMTVLVSGVITFQTGQKIHFPCGSYLAIFSGGTLDPGNGGGSSNLIDICGVVDWTASQGALTGPTCVPAGNPSCSAALPITLISFMAKWEQSSAVLQWITASEINNDHFELSRSSNGYDYETIATIKGQGNTTNLTNYSYVDESASSLTGNEIYYRLKQVDFDGKYVFYGPVVLKVPSEKSEFVVFPNPIAKSSVLHLLMNNRAGYKITLVDVYGREIFSEQVFSSESGSKLNIQLPDIALGLYTIICQSDGLSEQQKLVVIDN